MKQRTLSFNTRQLFRPIGTQQWYPPHAFSAQGSAYHFGLVRYYPAAVWSPKKNFFKKSHSGLRPPASFIRTQTLSSCVHSGTNTDSPGVTACQPIPWVGGDNRIPEDQHLSGGAARPSWDASLHPQSLLNRFAEVASMP